MSKKDLFNKVSSTVLPEQEGPRERLLKSFKDIMETYDMIDDDPNGIDVHDMMKRILENYKKSYEENNEIPSELFEEPPPEALERIVERIGTLGTFQYFLEEIGIKNPGYKERDGLLHDGVIEPAELQIIMKQLGLFLDNVDKEAMKPPGYSHGYNEALDLSTAELQKMLPNPKP